MEKIRYRKEVKIRIGYVCIGIRIAYLQRKRNEYTRLEYSAYQHEREEERLRKGQSERSRYFTRIRSIGIRRITTIFYRNRGPGRFQHEYRKRKGYIILRNGLCRLGSWKWYGSDVEVTREDRNRNYRFLLILCRRRNRIHEKMNFDQEVTYKQYNRRNVRTIYRWLNLILMRIRTDNRRERSNRRSRMRLRRGYGISIERRRRRRYRKEGRKRMK